jgi:hypothetical protein
MIETYIVGCDLGQKRDWTAIPVLARVPLAVPIGGKDTTYQIKHIDRIRRLSYVDIGRRIRSLVEKLPGPPPVVIDFTGVGRAVRDVLEELGIRTEIIPVNITSGATVHQEDGVWYVPKRDLVATVAILLESGRLKIGPTVPWAEVLTKELSNFRCKISASGHDSYAAGAAPDWRDGSHDDLVLGVALAAWWAERGTSLTPDDVSGGGNEGWAADSPFDSWGNSPSPRRGNPWD